MTELEKLIEQRREITRKIKELQTNQTVFGIVRMSKEENRGGYFKVSTLVNSLSGWDDKTAERWMPTICEREMETVIHKIRVIITDMSELLASIEGENQCEKE